MQLITVATCSLNQWALDLKGNKERIIESVRRAKKVGATLRIGPELEITGYGCLDHFLELDLYDQAWEVLRDVITHEDCQQIYLDIGIPIRHRSAYYNCRVVCYDARVLLIRPKMDLANDGNFREMRYFTPWAKEHRYECFDHELPECLKDVTHQTEPVPFGDCVIETDDTVIGIEMCEELFTPDAPHIRMGLNGVEIFTNSSGSHHELRKLHHRLELIREATRKSKGVYLYSNQQGCDGDRLYYDGCQSIIVNGEIVAQGSQFSLRDVEVTTATVDLDEIRGARFPPSTRLQATQAPTYKRIHLPVKLSRDPMDLTAKKSERRQVRFYCPEEEIALSPACWLWDYLRRSQQSGFFLPLSGGIDSCSTAVIVFSMCKEVIKAINEQDKQVIQDLRRICGEPEDSWWIPRTPQEVCNRIFHTCFMGTTNSSKQTRARAKELAKAIGAYHIDMDMDHIVNAFISTFTTLFKFTMKYKVHGGTHEENIALQNIQSRSRMVFSYLCAQTLPFLRYNRRERQSSGNLLVLGSANVDESLRGYLTKYDCSSADLNPIGGISKTDLKSFIHWAQEHMALPILGSFLTAQPTAELEPLTATHTQTDEPDMGTTYATLSLLGRLRKVHRLGPLGQFLALYDLWGKRTESDGTNRTTGNDAARTGPLATPRQILDKVVHFNHHYGINRHKMTTLTPSLHLEEYSCEDNRFDLRPFLYPRLAWAYEKIEGLVRGLEGKEGKGAGAGAGSEGVESEKGGAAKEGGSGGRKSFGSSSSAK